MEAGSESAFRAELSNMASVAGGHERVPVGREWEMQLRLRSPRLPGRCLRSQSALAHLLVQVKPEASPAGGGGWAGAREAYTQHRTAAVRV
jgi:hypothetical protein